MHKLTLAALLICLWQPFSLSLAALLIVPQRQHNVTLPALLPRLQPLAAAGITIVTTLHNSDIDFISYEYYFRFFISSNQV